MKIIDVVIGVFKSLVLAVARRGFLVGFVLCVLTKRWRDALTMECIESAHKLHTVSELRIGGIPLLLGWGINPLTAEATQVALLAKSKGCA